VSPFDFDPSGIAAFCELGDGSSHDPQIKFTAPDKSCAWNGYPVEIHCNPFQGCVAPVDPDPTYQTAGYATPFGAGPWTPPDSTWPFIHLYGILNPILCGYTLEYRVTGNITFGSSQIGVANPLTGCGGCSDPTYYATGGYDTGWQDAGGPDCAQAATATDDHTYFTVVLRPFSPIVGAGFTNGVLRIRWVGGGGSPPAYDPFQTYRVFFAAPGGPELGSRSLTFGDAPSTSPPAPDWTNSVEVGDNGMETVASGYGVKSVSGHGSMWWNTRMFEAQQAAEVYVKPKPGGTNALYIFLRLTNPGTANVCGYYLKGTNTTAEVYRLDNGVSTLIDSFPLPHPMSSDNLGYRFWMTGSLYGVQANMSLPPPWSTSSLPFVGGGSDATYGDPGFIGLGLDGTTGVIVSAWATNGNGNAAVFPGLHIWLPTDSCGDLSKTYSQIKTTLDLMNVAETCPIIATINHNGSDLAQPDLAAMAGAHCTGGTYYREGMETP
jgi:hypothetical protein